MATFIGLLNWTDQGIRNFRDTNKRADAFGDLIQSMGGELKGIWWTIGPYDIVALMEAPDEQTVTAALLKVGALGNIRSTTLRAFSREEFEGIIGRAE